MQNYGILRIYFSRQSIYNEIERVGGDGDVDLENDNLSICRSCLDRFDVQVLRTLR